MNGRRLMAFLLVALATVATPASAGLAEQANSRATPKRGGHLTIARIEDSQSFDKTNVFQNESIQQINESLYTATPDGKGLRPWLATSYTISKNRKTYTFKLRRGVRFSNGQPMTAADVKFSIDDARAPKRGWAFLDVAIKNVQAPDDSTVVINLKYPWTPFLADVALVSNGSSPAPSSTSTRSAPDRSCGTSAWSGGR